MREHLKRNLLLGVAAAAVIAAAIIALASGGGHTPVPGRPAARVGMPRGEQQLAAGYLGLSLSDLRSGLHSGRSLAELAAAQGRSRAGLIEALAALRIKRLRAAVAERKISTAEEAAALSRLHKRVLRLVERRRRTPAG